MTTPQPVNTPTLEVRSAEMPVEPDDVAITLFGNKALAHVADYIDTLQSALKLAQEERDAKDRLITNYEEWLSVSGENAKELQERAEKAESLNRRMVELLKEPSEGIADSVRGVLQMLRNRSGVTYEQIKEHCSMRGDDLSWWPKWADDVLPAYVTEQGAALLLFKAMSAELLKEVEK